MKCNQFCLCRLQHSVVNYRKFSILEREKQLFHVHVIIHDGRDVSFAVLHYGLLTKNPDPFPTFFRV